MMPRHPFSEPGPYTHPIVNWTLGIVLCGVVGLFGTILWVSVPSIIRFG